LVNSISTRNNKLVQGCQDIKELGGYCSESFPLNCWKSFVTVQDQLKYCQYMRKSYQMINTLCKEWLFTTGLSQWVRCSDLQGSRDSNKGNTSPAKMKLCRRLSFNSSASSKLYNCLQHFLSSLKYVSQFCSGW